MIAGLMLPVFRSLEQARFAPFRNSQEQRVGTYASHCPIVMGTLVLADRIMVLVAGEAFAFGPILRVLIVATGIIL
jgi:hypothetical protein